MISIPLQPSLPEFDEQVSLDGANYTLSLRWNVRASAWFMDVYDDQETTLLAGGIKLVLGALLGIERTGRQPPGAFMVLDTSGAGVEAGLDDFGVRVRLEYLTADDLATIGI